MEQAAASPSESGKAAARRRQRATLLGLLIAFVILSAWLARELLGTAREVAAQHRMERETLVFLDRVEGLFAAVKDAESSLRGEVLTGERVFRDDFSRALPRARELAVELRRDPRIQGADGADLRNFLTRVESRLSALENVDRAMQESGTEAAVDLLRSQVRSEPFGAIRQVKEGIDRRLHKQLEDVESADQRALSILYLAMAGIALNLLLVLALAVLVLRQNRQRRESQTALIGLNQRLEHQLANSRRLGEGLARLGKLGQLLQASERTEEAADAIRLSLPRMLEAFGDLLLQRARKEDMPCRLGGEEFVLIMPETTLAQAHQRGNVIRAALEGQVVEHLGQPVGIVTLSAGVAAYPEHGDSLDPILRAADAALYAAKQAGRNRVVVAPCPVGDQEPER